MRVVHFPDQYPPRPFTEEDSNVMLSDASIAYSKLVRYLEAADEDSDYWRSRLLFDALDASMLLYRDFKGNFGPYLWNGDVEIGDEPGVTLERSFRMLSDATSLHAGFLGGTLAKMDGRRVVRDIALLFSGDFDSSDFAESFKRVSEQ